VATKFISAYRRIYFGCGKDEVPVVDVVPTPNISLALAGACIDIDE